MSRINAIARPTILRRRALARDRTKRWRARRAAGKRTVQVAVELVGGVTLRQIEIDDALCEDALVELGLLESWQADFPEIVDEAAKALCLRLAAAVTRHAVKRGQ